MEDYVTQSFGGNRAWEPVHAACRRTHMNGTEPYLKAFERREQKNNDPAWLTPLRRAGITRFQEQGFPTMQQEDWRFTNVAPLLRLPFKPNFKAGTAEAAAPALERYPFRSIPGRRLVFVDGHFAPELSSAPGPASGALRIGSLAEALDHDAETLKRHLGRYAEVDGNAFAALNQAFFQDGALIQVPAGMELPDPVHVICVCTAARPGAAVHLRNVLVAGPDSKATVFESYLSNSGAAYVTNSVTELMADDNATLELLKFQDESTDAFHVATLQGRFGRAANVRMHSFALGARLSRNNIRTRLSGEGLECILNGLYLTRDEQLADHHMVVEHAEPHCASHEYFNGILHDHSRGVFHGRIYVHPAAQKTDAKQTNKNLLLSDDATVNTKPQLEIYADDVKCTHGATVGQLSDEAVFYLRSRGISPQTARRMLIHAFAGEIIERIECEPAREKVNQVVWDRLEQYLPTNGKG